MINLNDLTDARPADPVSQALLAFETAHELDMDSITQLTKRFSHLKEVRAIVDQLGDAATLRSEYVQNLRLIL